MPQLSVTVAFLLVLASVAVFFAFIHHITTSIQVGQVIDRVALRTVQSLERGDDEEWDRPRPTHRRGHRRPDRRWSSPPGTGTARCSGCTTRTSSSGPSAAGVVVELRTRLGDVRHRGQELALVHGAVADDDIVGEVRSAFGLGRDRTMGQDPEFGVRQLVDIAERALSPGINDPTTAVQVLDELHRILRRAASRADRSAYLVDGGGVVRVIDAPTTFARLLDLSLDEIAHYGADTLQVPAHIDLVLEDLESMARQEHAATVVAKRADLRSRHGGRHEAPA